MKRSCAYLIVFVLLLSSCLRSDDEYVWMPLDVMATAYNFVPSQTQGDPFIAAWGDSLDVNTPSIAVSKNLIALGLKRNTPVKIEGFEEVFLVRDKMNSRFINRIDIYMGDDVAKAKEWGAKELTIHYGIHRDSIKVEFRAR